MRPTEYANRMSAYTTLERKSETEYKAKYSRLRPHAAIFSFSSSNTATAEFAMHKKNMSLSTATHTDTCWVTSRGYVPKNNNTGTTR